MRAGRQTDRQTDKETDVLITMLRTAPGGEVTTENLSSPIDVHPGQCRGPVYTYSLRLITM